MFTIYKRSLIGFKNKEVPNIVPQRRLAKYQQLININIMTIQFSIYSILQYKEKDIKLVIDT